MTLSPTSAERFAIRARRRRWVLARRVVGVVLVVAVLAALGWVVLYSDVLGVRRVRVDGAVVLDEARIREAVGVRPGTPLARVDTSSVAARVAELRWVAGVEVRRGWPHTLLVRVVERSTRAVVRDGPRYGLVDAQGVVFTRVSRPPTGVPVIGGDAAEYEQDTLRGVVRVLADLPLDLQPRVSRVRARSMDSVVLSLSDGTRVVWGSAEHGSLKADVLTTLLRRKARVYDVSAPRAPAVRW